MKYIILFLTSFLLLTSCSKEKVDKKPCPIRIVIKSKGTCWIYGEPNIKEEKLMSRQSWTYENTFTHDGPIKILFRNTDSIDVKVYYQYYYYTPYYQYKGISKEIDLNLNDLP